MLLSVVDPITTGVKTVVVKIVPLVTTVTTKKSGTTGKSARLIAAVSDLGRLAVTTTKIVAPGLHLRRGAIMMRGNLQGTMITDGEVMMMTAEPLIIIMTVAGMMTGDVKTAVADATRKTIGTTTGQ
jgi:hypothetical protein